MADFSQYDSFTGGGLLGDVVPSGAAPVEAGGMINESWDSASQTALQNNLKQQQAIRSIDTNPILSAYGQNASQRWAGTGATKLSAFEVGQQVTADMHSVAHAGQLSPKLGREMARELRKSGEITGQEYFNMTGRIDASGGEAGRSKEALSIPDGSLMHDQGFHPFALKNKAFSNAPSLKPSATVAVPKAAAIPPSPQQYAY